MKPTSHSWSLQTSGRQERTDRSRERREFGVAPPPLLSNSTPSVPYRSWFSTFSFSSRRAFRALRRKSVSSSKSAFRDRSAAATSHASPQKLLGDKRTSGRATMCAESAREFRPHRLRLRRVSRGSARAAPLAEPEVPLYTLPFPNFKRQLESATVDQREVHTCGNRKTPTTLPPANGPAASVQLHKDPRELTTPTQNLTRKHHNFNLLQLLFIDGDIKKREHSGVSCNVAFRRVWLRTSGLQQARRARVTPDRIDVSALKR